MLPMLIAVSFTAVMEFFANDKVNLVFSIIFISLSLIHPAFLLGIPLILYDLFFSRNQIILLGALVSCLINYQSYPFQINFFIFNLIGITYILKYKSVQYKNLHEEYIRKRDELMEMSLNLKKKIYALVDREDFQVKLATLNERNRIAHEIHDSIGHLLTSSIIQLGAIQAITKEEVTKTMVNNVKNTLDEGMNSIRNSIHNIHEDSVDLYVQIKSILSTFNFCEITLNYEIEMDLDIKIKYACIAIIKEALANVIKHSSATKVTISLYEHPKLIQLIIMDNGLKKVKKEDNGMGIQGIRDRVNSLGGFINIDDSGGFKIFISFMKELKKDENNCS